MSKQFSIAQIFLWLYVIVLGISIGGGLYEQLVLMPLWSLAPPDSVIAYYQHNVANPQFVPNQGGRFWIFFTPALGLLASVSHFRIEDAPHTSQMADGFDNYCAYRYCFYIRLVHPEYNHADGRRRYKTERRANNQFNELVGTT